MKSQTDLKVVLNDLSKDELIRIVDEIASEDSILKKRLLLQYSKTTIEQEVEQFKSLVNDIIHKYSGREMFVAYREVSGFSRELGDCVFEIEATEDALTALELAFILLEKAIEAFQYADDSNGDIGSLVEETLEVIDVIIIEAIEWVTVKDKLFLKRYYSNVSSQSLKVGKSIVIRYCTLAQTLRISKAIEKCLLGKSNHSLMKRRPNILSDIIMKR